MNNEISVRFISFLSVVLFCSTFLACQPEQYDNSLVKIRRTEVADIIEMVPVGGIRGYLPATATNGTLKIYTNIYKNDNAHEYHFKGSIVDIQSVYLSNLDLKTNRSGTYLCFITNSDKKYYLYHYYKSEEAEEFMKVFECEVTASKILGYVKDKDQISLILYSDSYIYQYSSNGEKTHEYQNKKGDVISATYNCRLVDNVLRWSNNSLSIYKPDSYALLRIKTIQFEGCPDDTPLLLNKYFAFTHAYADSYILVYYNSEVYFISTSTLEIIHKEKIDNIEDIISNNFFSTRSGWLLLDILESGEKKSLVNFKLDINSKAKGSYFFIDQNSESDCYFIDNKMMNIVFMHLKREHNNTYLYQYTFSPLIDRIEKVFVSKNNPNKIFVLSNHYLYTFKKQINLQQIHQITLQYKQIQ